MVSKLNSSLLKFLLIIRWDALFNGQYKAIDPWRIPSELKESVQSFHSRDPITRNNPWEIQKLQDQINDAADNIDFALFSGYTQDQTNMPVDIWNSCINGQTSGKDHPGHERVTCFIAVSQNSTKTVSLAVRNKLIMRDAD